MQIWNHTPWFASRRTQPAAAQNRHRAPLEAAGDSALLRISSAKLQVEQVATTAGQLLAPNTSQAEMHALPAASVLGKRARHIDVDPTEQETLRMIAKLSHHDVRRLLVRSARESKDVRAAIKAQYDAAVEVCTMTPACRRFKVAHAAFVVLAIWGKLCEVDHTTLYSVSAHVCTHSTLSMLQHHFLVARLGIARSELF